MKLKGKAKKAFLARMKRGRNKKHGNHKHKKHKKHHTGGKHVAKRRHHTSKKHKGGKRRSHGSMGRWLPDQHKLVGMGTAFAYGKVEAAASKDTAHFLNKVPPIIAQIGRAGNLGAMAWVAGVITRKPVIKSIASGLLHVAAYQNGRNTGGFSKDKADFSLSGPGHHRPGRGHDEMKVEEYLRRGRGE